MSTKTSSSTRWVLLLTITLLVVFVGLFLLEFVRASQRPAAIVETLTADSYLAEVTPLLADADPARGEALIQKYECHICHIDGADRIAPTFVDVGTRAATRRPPLAAEAYLYESITHPGAFLAEKPTPSAPSTGETSAKKTFSNAMPSNYATRLKPQELGDIIAYLLTQ